MAENEDKLKKKQKKTEREREKKTKIQPHEYQCWLTGRGWMHVAKT